MSNQLVSIIVPVYNTSNYLERLCLSLYNQTYVNLEIIFINDGSTDNSQLLLEQYCLKDKRAILINKNNGGLSSARNIGLRYISDDSIYITFIDSDDWIDNNYIETLVRLSLNNNCDIVSSVVNYGDKIAISPTTNQIYSSLTATRMLIEDRVIHSFVPSKLFRRELWGEIRFPEEMKYMEDVCTTFKVFLNAKNVLTTNYNGYHYFQGNENSLMKSKITNRKIIYMWESWKRVCDYNFSLHYKNHLNINHLAYSSFMDAYLELLPRFFFKTANDYEKNEYKKFTKFVLCNKLIKYFKPYSKKTRIKKFCFMFVRPLYVPLFRLYKGNKK